MKVKLASIAFRVISEKDILPSFQRVIAQVVKQQKTNFFIGQFVHDLSTAFAEGVANVIRHADEISKFGKVECSFKLTSQKVEIRIVDHGTGFDLSKIPLPKFESFKESGRGIFMMRQLMDSVDYTRGKKRNILVLKRHLIGSDPETRALDLLYEISDAILESTDLKAVYEIILDKAIEVFRVERASVLIYDKNIKKLTVVASRGLKAPAQSPIQLKSGEGISGYVFQHAKPCLIEDMGKNSSGWEQKKQYKSASFISAPMICSPMRLGQESIGVINMTDRVDGRPFTKRDLQLLTTIANQATAYLHMYRLLSEAKDAELMRRELEIAHQIQKSYLPSASPKVFGLDLAGWCETAQSVGGDYYDFIERDNQYLYVVIADVSGHNVAAALTMANFRAHLRGLLLTEENPGSTLTHLNRNLFKDLSRSDQFISMLLVRFNLKSQAIEMASAGHRFPLILKKSGEQIEEITEYHLAGSVLGAIENETYATSALTLQSHDWMILYTDGVIEMMNPQMERLGFDRLVQVVKKQTQGSAQQMIEALSREVKKFRSEAAITDDVTAIAIRKE